MKPMQEDAASISSTASFAASSSFCPAPTLPGRWQLPPATQTCSDLPQISFSNHTHFGPVPKCLRTEAMPINNSCKCSKFGINGLRLHVTNFRMSCMGIKDSRPMRELGRTGRAAKAAAGPSGLAASRFSLFRIPCFLEMCEA